ncbi:hypothetical protein [Roseovarius spongiae]|uniref:hypothetical protein n=1 Tax=Roseovarius spongiae TaxID=2320272 RepID=UPI001FE812FC|nr:hypothetical protein [Roseovarius spongiae]
MADAAGLLPLIGAVLLMIPLLWQGGGVTKTSHVMFYVFGIWALLAVLSALVSGILDHDRHADADADTDTRAQDKNDAPPPPGTMG